MEEQIMARKEERKVFREYPDLMQAARALASVDGDRASVENNMGYNKRDTEFMCGLAGKNKWSTAQAKAAYKVLHIYRKQLQRSFGIDYDTLIDPSTITEAVEEKKMENRKEARKAGKDIIISFAAEKSEFYDLLGKIKSLDGRRFNSTTRLWSVPVSRTAVNKLQEWGFVLDDELQKHMQGQTDRVQKKDDEVHIDGLYPFQTQGVQFIESKDGRCLIGDEMGLGKTVQALAYLKLHPELRPAIIVVPASLKINWARESAKWIPNERPYVVYGRNNASAYKNKSIIVINYDILEAHLESIEALKPNIMIMDEVHYIKTADAKRTKAAKRLGKSIEHIIGLSGTPITNRPIEFFSILNMLRPDIFRGRFHFAMKYCGARHNGFGWDFNGASNIEELHKIVTDTVMIRRLKSDVLKELPQKQRTVIPVSICNRSEYDAAESDLIAWIEENEGREAAERASRAEILTRFEKLKQMAVKGKQHMAFEWIDSFVESDQKLVLFATHRDVIDILMERYKDVAVKIDGRDSAGRRQHAVDSFQNDDRIRLFIGQIEAAGVGLTLTAASNVAFLELDWVPGNHDQAEDRVHRIGQEADSINCWYLIAEETIEEDIVDILDSKRKVIDAVLDGRESDDGSILRELMSRIKK